MTPLTDIAGQTAIVTGGARGFGLGIARRLAAAKMPGDPVGSEFR